LAVPAFARIGETLEQAKQRYGEIRSDDTFKGLRRVQFLKNGFLVSTFFTGDRIGSINFVKMPKEQDGKSERVSEEMSVAEIQNFLKFNGGEKQWKQVAERTWTAPGLSALYFYDTEGPTDDWKWVLAIFTDEYLHKIAAYHEAEEARNQAGF
jgi:hypothetical protein